jgi:opacity protein-like surface antigen
MKRVLLVLVLGGLLSGRADAQVSLGWGVQGNAANLNVSGSLGTVYGWGYGGGAHLDVNLLMISVRLEGDYVSFAPDQEKYRTALAALLGSAASGYAIDGGNVAILSGNLNAKWALLPLPVVSPYLTGGVGLARMSTGSLTITYQGVPVSGLPEVEAQTRTAFNLGAGVDLKFAGVALYVEGKYVWITSEGGTTGYVPISVGLTF